MTICHCLTESAAMTKAKQAPVVDTSTLDLPNIPAASAELSSQPANTDASVSLAALDASAQAENITKKTRAKKEFLTSQEVLFSLTKIMQKVDPEGPLFMHLLDAMVIIRA